jgi:hypothetical protein
MPAWGESLSDDEAPSAESYPLAEGRQELLSLWNELDSLSEARDSIAVSLVLGFLACILFLLGMDAQSWAMMAGSLVPGLLAGTLLGRDARRGLRKRELLKRIEAHDHIGPARFLPPKGPAMTSESLKRELLELERSALDRWSGGDPAGYGQWAAEEVTYFDDMGARERVAGKDALLEYLDSLKEHMPPHRYEMGDPLVQIFGDMGIVSFLYLPSTLDGQAGTPWRASTVYALIDGKWQMVHAHWAMMKDEG